MANDWVVSLLKKKIIVLVNFHSSSINKKRMVAEYFDGEN